MRRPFWMPVSICLGLLLAHQARGPRAPMVETEPASAPPSPFAWIQEDGTEVYVSAQGSRIASPDVELVPASTTHALYTWSSPLNGEEAERAWYP